MFLQGGLVHIVRKLDRDWYREQDWYNRKQWLLGCARFTDFCANSWRLDCFSHSITMEAFTPARCKTAKIHRNEHRHGPCLCFGLVWTFVYFPFGPYTKSHLPFPCIDSVQSMLDRMHEQNDNIFKRPFFLIYNSRIQKIVFLPIKLV